MAMSDHDALLARLGLNVPLHQELSRATERLFEQSVGAQPNRPQAMAYFDGVLHGAHGRRIAELADARATGRKVVGTFCIYVPEELALAVDAIPIALCGGSQFTVPFAERTFPRDICPLVKSTLGMAFAKVCPYGPILDYMVGETTCDVKKKTWEILADDAFHVMEVPQKKEPVDVELWRRSVREFRGKMEALAGKKVTRERLAESVRVMNDKRRALQRLASLRQSDPPPVSGLDALAVMQGALNDEPVRFTRNLQVLNDELEQRVAGGVSPFPKGTKRIMVSGCPAVAGNWKLHHLIESSGAVVVADETCTGSRYFGHLVEERAGLDELVTAVADRYLKVNCSCFTPNSERLDDVRRLARECRVDGVVQYVLQYCHTYNVEAIRVESALREAGVPSLKLVTDYSEEDTGQLRTRIEAFLEQLG
jgi:benzoyl-CoA reductase/2-hydroxyglutaryl-CoA dehydratase subunit BcrC/BadD/HgdB